MAKAITYRELVKRLKKRDKRYCIYANKGKGSHRMIYHPDLDGKEVSCPVPCHASKNLSKGVLGSIKRAFGLPSDFFE